MNMLDKLAKEKFNGDLRAAWSYLFYECSKEERDKYTKYVTKKQLDIGMTAIKRQHNLNEIDRLAAEKFNGDLKATWKHIFSTCSSEEIDRYVSIADKHQASLAFMMLDEESKKVAKSEVRVQDRIDKNLATLNLSRDEVLNAKKNPYKANVLKSVFKVALTSSAIIGLSALNPALGLGASSLAATNGLLGILNTCFAFDLAEKLQKYFKFKNTKNQLHKNQNQLDNDRGRGM